MHEVISLQDATSYDNTYFGISSGPCYFLHLLYYNMANFNRYVFDMHIQLLYMLRNNSIKYCNTFTFCATQDSVTLLITMLQA